MLSVFGFFFFFFITTTCTKTTSTLNNYSFDPEPITIRNRIIFQRGPSEDTGFKCFVRNKKKKTKITDHRHHSVRSSSAAAPVESERERQDDKSTPKNVRVHALRVGLHVYIGIILWYRGNTIFFTPNRPRYTFTRSLYVRRDAGGVFDIRFTACV